MKEEEVAIFKIQNRGHGNFMVTVPKKYATEFMIKKGDTVKVFVDKTSRRIIYQFMSSGIE